MQEDLEFKMSMLVDGELDAGEEIRVLTEIRNSPELMKKWNRYNAARSVVGRQDSLLADIRFFEGVCETVGNEPAILSPASLKRNTTPRTRAYAVALAASVAVVGIISWSNFPSSFNSPGGVQVLTTSEQLPAPVAVDTSRSKRLYDYVLTHNESAYSSGGQYMLPYARVVSYSTDQ